MPVAPRPSGKAQRIAHAILGSPLNMRKRRGKKNKRENLLIAQETRFTS